MLYADAGGCHEARRAKLVIVSTGLAYEGLDFDALVTARRREEREGDRRQRRQSHRLRLGNDPDPHAWQSVANAKIYVANIRDALIEVDPADKSTFEANAAAYLSRVDALDAEVTAEIANIPPDRRKLITSHDAFGYFGTAYGIDVHRAARGLDRSAGLGARCGEHHRPDQRREDSGGVSGEHDRPAAPGAHRARVRRAMRSRSRGSVTFSRNTARIFLGDEMGAVVVAA